MRRLLLAVALCAAALLLGMAWLLFSASGRDFVLARGVAGLPPDTLTWGAAQGSLAGPLELHDVRYRTDGHLLTIDRLRIDHALLPLFGRRLDIADLQIDTLRVQLADAPSEPAPLRIQLPQQLPWPDIDLPLALYLKQARIERIEVIRGGEVVLPSMRLVSQEIVLADAALRLAGVQLDRSDSGLRIAGELGLSGEPQGDLRAAWQRGAAANPEATLVLSGADDELRIDLQLADAGELQLTLDQRMNWQLQTDLVVTDTRRWLPEQPPRRVALKLDGRGTARSAQLDGRLQLDAQGIDFADGQWLLAADGGALSVQGLRLQPDSGGTVELSGSIDFDEGMPVDLSARIDGIQVPTAEGQPPLAVDGRLLARGVIDELRIELIDGRLRRDTLEADLQFAGTLLPGEFGIEQMALRNPQGALQVDGRAAWEPATDIDLRVQLSDFDPALLLPDLPGRIDGNLSVALSQPSDAAAAPDLQVTIDRLRGELRGRPLRATGSLRLGDRDAAADLDLRLGESQLLLSGDPGSDVDLRLQLQPLQLGDLLPAAAGRVQADLRIHGERNAPRIDGSIDGSELRYADATIASLSARLQIGRAATAPLQVDLEADGIARGDLRIDRLQLQLDGSQQAHAAQLSVSGGTTQLSARVDGGLDGENWSGQLQAFDLRLGERRRWQLDDTASIGWRDRQLNVERACLRGTPNAELCVTATADAQGQVATAELRAVDLAAFSTLFGAVPVRVEGALDGDLRFEQRDGGPATGRLTLRSSAGSLAETELPERQLLRWNGLQLDGELDAAGLRLRLAGALDDGGRIDGEVVGGSPFEDPGAALDGRIELQLPKIGALELVLPDLANLQGRLAANLGVAGQWNAPQLTGRVDVDGIAAELPALGIRIRDSNLQLRGDRGRFELTARIDTGEGALQVDGETDDPFGAAPEAQLRLKGERVRVADSPTLSALVSPDLQLRMSDDGLRLRGSVEVPEARIAIDHLDSALSPSPDVVVLDPKDGNASNSRLPLRARIEVRLGDKVTLQGFGFDGGISGELTVTERPGRATTGRGTLNVRGNYRAYGQDLEIQRGRLLFATSPLDDPALQVRAQRKVDDVTVGIEVSGSARLPQLSVWSDPALDQAEALSYLVLGRPLRSASSAEGAELGQAAAALGGNLLAKRLNARLGFDTFGVADSQALGGAAFTVGKYLSPALYLSYGVSLFGSGQVITLRYLLSSRWDLEVESGAQSRAGINYSIER